MFVQIFRLKISLLSKFRKKYQNAWPKELIIIVPQGAMPTQSMLTFMIISRHAQMIHRPSTNLTQFWNLAKVTTILK